MSEISLKIESDSIERISEYDSLLVPNDMPNIASELFEDTDLATFYNLAYGKMRGERAPGDFDFYHHFIESMGNFDIEIKKPLTREPPNCFKATETIDVGLDLPVEEEFATLQHPHSLFEISYTHPVKQTFGPKQSYTTERQAHYFLSPTKIVIRTECPSTGFMYANSFYPVMISQLEEVEDANGRTAVQFNQYFKIHFVKKIPFIGGSIAKEALKESRSNFQDVFTDLIRKELGIKTNVRLGSRSPRASEIP
jgi:hypothetical protein